METNRNSNRATEEKRMEINPAQTVNEKKEWTTPELVELGVKGTRQDGGTGNDFTEGSGHDS